MEETWKNAHNEFNWDSHPREVRGSGSGRGKEAGRETSQALAEENPQSFSVNT